MESERMVVDWFVWLVCVRDQELKLQKPTLSQSKILSFFSRLTINNKQKGKIN